MSKEYPNLAVKRATTGLGLFALRRIPANRRIVEYVGPIISEAERKIKGGKYLFELEDKRAIDGSSRDNIARYINHSCEPNAKAWTTRNRVWIWSERAIEPGEEITIDYGEEYLDEFIKPKGCKCKACISK
jgi:SET domain-containing protein